MLSEHWARPDSIDRGDMGGSRECGRVETGRLLTTSEQSKGVTGEDASLQQAEN